MSGPTARRLVLARLALEDAPTPVSIRFHDYEVGTHLLSLDFETIAQAIQWGQAHGADREPRIWTDPERGRRHGYVSVPDWLGWPISISAVESAIDDTLPDEVKGQLTELAGDEQDGGEAR